MHSEHCSIQPDPSSACGLPAGQTFHPKRKHLSVSDAVRIALSKTAVAAVPGAERVALKVYRREIKAGEWLTQLVMSQRSSCSGQRPGSQACLLITAQQTHRHTTGVVYVFVHPDCMLENEISPFTTCVTQSCSSCITCKLEHCWPAAATLGWQLPKLQLARHICLTLNNLERQQHSLGYCCIYCCWCCCLSESQLDLTTATGSAGSRPQQHTV